MVLMMIVLIVARWISTAERSCSAVVHTTSTNGIVAVLEREAGFARVTGVYAAVVEANAREAVGGCCCFLRGSVLREA
eukprot:scaffold63450_cov67-Cyclotella_meneghiniana.AAC.2